MSKIKNLKLIGMANPKIQRNNYMPIKVQRKRNTAMIRATSRKNAKHLIKTGNSRVLNYYELKNHIDKIENRITKKVF